VDTYTGDITLPEIGIKLDGLHRREKALYALILLESRTGGINFVQPSDAKHLKKYNHRMAVLQMKYAIIYSQFGGEKDKAPILEVAQTRLPMLSVIKREFRRYSELLNQPDDYLVQRNIFGNYCVKIPPELGLCCDSSAGELMRFEDSDFWSKILAM